MGKLDGKVALVTGSGRNIGRATVLKLAGEGAHVVVNARSNQAEADAVAREARDRGVKALAVIADVAKKDQVDAMVARAMSEFGRIDILINNAAIRPHKPFTEVTMQDWEHVRGVVLDGALYCTQGAIGSGLIGLRQYMTSVPVLGVLIVMNIADADIVSSLKMSPSSTAMTITITGSTKARTSTKIVAMTATVMTTGDTRAGTIHTTPTPIGMPTTTASNRVAHIRAAATNTCEKYLSLGGSITGRAA